MLILTQNNRKGKYDIVTENESMDAWGWGWED